MKQTRGFMLARYGVRKKDPLVMPLQMGIAAAKNPFHPAAEHIMSFVKLHDLINRDFRVVK